MIDYSQIELRIAARMLDPQVLVCEASQDHRLRIVMEINGRKQTVFAQKFTIHSVVSEPRRAVDTTSAS